MFSEKDDLGRYIDRNGFYKIKPYELNELEQQRLWLNRNYYDILCRMAVEKISENQHIDDEVEKLSRRYGEIMLPQYDEDKTLLYSDQFGLVVQYSK